MDLPINEFFDITDFAETVHYTAPDGVTRDILAIVSMADSTTKAGDGQYENLRSSAWVRSRDVEGVNHKAIVGVDAVLVDS